MPHEAHDDARPHCAHGAGRAVVMSPRAPGADRFDAHRARSVAQSFDLANLSADFYANPYPYYHALREHAPVKRMPDGSWFLSRYDDIVPVYRDAKAFSSDKKKEFGP